MSAPEMVTLVHDPDAPAPAKVDLFHLNDVTYQIPAKPRVNVALRYLWQAKTLGETSATAGLLEALLGSEGFLALTEYDELTAEQFGQIVAIAQKVTLGALEQNAGEGARGSAK